MRLRTLLAIGGVAALALPQFASANVSACYTPNKGVDVSLTNFKSGDSFVRQIKLYDANNVVSDKDFAFTGKGSEAVTVSYPATINGVATLAISHRGKAPYETINVPLCPTTPVEETPVVEDKPVDKVVEKTPEITPKPKAVCNAKLRAVYRNGAGMKWVRIARQRGCVPQTPPPTWLCKRGAGRSTYIKVLGPRKGEIEYNRCNPAKPIVPRVTIGVTG